MRGSVDLDAKPGPIAIKVEHIRSGGMLLAKVKSGLVAP
jgi:hypothetical protein